MRVTDDNRLQASLLVDPFDSFVVEQRQAVPEDVSVVGGFDQDCALADGEFGGRDERVEVGVRVDLGPRVGVLGLGGEAGAGGPGLAVRGDVLARVLWFGLGG